MTIRTSLSKNADRFRHVLQETYHKSKSCCKRKKVACAIIDPKDGYVFHSFVNQNLFGECSGERGNCGCCHAEPQAVIWAMLHGRERDGFILSSTYAPCRSCANLIVLSAKFVGVVFAHYTDHDMLGLEILRKNDIDFCQIQDCNIPDVK